MEYKQTEIKKGIKLHTIKTDKFKTNLIAIMLTTKLNRENVTKNALIPTVLKRGTKNLKTQEEINKKLEEMYGASLDCGLDKTGDNQVLKFYIETVNDEFLPQEAENMLKTSLEEIFEFVFNPYLENNCFKKEYVEQEKENLKQIIEGKIDNKARYSLDRCIEEMYKDKPFGLYKYGYIEDMKNIDEENLYEYYQKLINECKIDIFVSGIVDENTENVIKNNENIAKLGEREPQYNKTEIVAKKSEKEKDIQESMEVTQGKLIIGMDLDIDDDNLRYDVMIYNSLFGGSANSKLFQNVREKASLAYTASSSYYRFKNNIFINCGIEIPNYEKALEIIKQQIEDMKKGDFTDEEVENAKKGIIASIKTIDDEQDTEITYFFSQELSQNKCDIEQYINRIAVVNKENVIEIANKVSINTIYFLKD
ncbi:MAG: EF-P 5-aminopentanol modification-associated protein YfmF [Clostridia bacterium]